MEIKIVFTGVSNAGKTTAVAALSDLRPPFDDADDGDAAPAASRSGAGFDYGVARLGPSDRIHLFGIPDGARFDALWRILAREALGVALLIDNSQADPLAQLDALLAGLGDHLDELACVVAVGRLPTHPGPGLEAFVARLAAGGRVFPVVEADVRRRGDVLMLVALLLAQAEARMFRGVAVNRALDCAGGAGRGFGR